MRDSLRVAATILLIKSAGLAHFAYAARVGARSEDALSETILVRLVEYFDAQHYEAISCHGYSFDNAISTARHPFAPSHAFFPLFPLLLSGLRSVFGDGIAYDTAVVGANAFLSLLGGVFLHKALSRIYGPAVAFWSIVFLFVSPTAIFFEMKYTESLFLCFTGLVAFFVSSKKRFLAAPAGFLGGLSRPQGATLAFLLVEYKRPIRWKESVIALAPILGFISYATYVAINMGEPFAVISVQQNWGRDFDMGGWFATGNFVDISYVFVALTCLFLGWSWLRRPEFAFFGAQVLVPLATGSLLSFSRFSLVAYPLFVVLALGAEKSSFRYANAVILYSCLIGRVVVDRTIAAGGFVA